MSRLASAATAAALLLAALAGCGTSAAAESPLTAPATGDDFTDPVRWPSLPELPDERLLTLDDVSAALPGGAPYGEATADWVTDPWRFAWCDDDAGPGRQLAAAPPPRDQQSAIWVGKGYPSTVGAPFGAFVTIHAVRWDPTGEHGLESARQWSAALRDDAAGCPDEVALDASGMPGEQPLLTATSGASGSWELQAVTTGGPTGLRFDVSITAAGAEEAGAAVVPLVVSAVEGLAAADDLAAHLRDHPGDRPALTAEHLMEDTQFDSGTAATPPAVTGPLLPEQVVAGWCDGAPALEVELPEQAWGTSWVKPAAEGVDVLAVDERLLRFTGIGDAAGLAAAEAYSRALHEGAAACPDAVPVELTDDQVVPERHGTDVLVSGADEGDGSWTTTLTARDAVTVLVLQERSTTPDGWSTDLALGLLDDTWGRIRYADSGPEATASLESFGVPAAGDADQDR